VQIKKKVAYITISDPEDKHAWSGTNYYIHKALIGAYADVIALGPAEPKWVTLICKIIHGTSLIFFKRRFDYRASTWYAKACSSLFSKRLKNDDFDLIVAPAGIACIAYLKTDIPILFVGDRVIAGALNYHTIVSDLWKWSEKQSIQTEHLAFEKAARCIFSSPWAAEHARRLHHLDDKKILVLPFGANMDNLPEAAVVLSNPAIKTKIIKLLFVGANWRDKGAQRAVNALNYLIAHGFEAQLTIVGCVAPVGEVFPHVTIIPFLNKNTASGLTALQQLFLESTFFILPTRFDCTPIVFCEASAFALPVLTANTGGVAGHVASGRNGYLIDYDDMGEAYAKKIIEIIQQAGAYEQLCVSTRKEFDDRLNWTSWMQKVSASIQEI